MTRRIAILLTNDDNAKFAGAYPNDGEKFAARLLALRPDWLCEVLSVKDGVFPSCAPAFDGYLITGSPASVNNAALPWVAPLLELIREIDRLQVPTVGLCFGHQAIAKALGGTVANNPGGWCLGVHTSQITRPEAWMTPPSAQLQLMAAHNEQVTQPPASARILGGSAFCPVGCMAIGQHLFSSQYHPEMTPAFMADLLMYLDGKLDAGLLARARDQLGQLGQALDDALLFHWIVQFLELPRSSV